MHSDKLHYTGNKIHAKPQDMQDMLCQDHETLPLNITACLMISILISMLPQWLNNTCLCSIFQVYVSNDLGRKWTLLQERVTKDKVFW